MRAARTARIYVDGQIQSEATDVGISAQSKKNQINLAMRALYDLWNTAPDNEKPQYETDDTGYNKLGEAYQFFLGRSYDDYRPLNGKIAEAYARTDLGQYVRHSKPAGRSDASWLLEVQRCLGQYGQGLFDVPQ